MKMKLLLDKKSGPVKRGPIKSFLFRRKNVNPLSLLRNLDLCEIATLGRSKADFFNAKDKKYWETLLEIFAKRVALETILTESLVALGRDGRTAELAPLSQAPF